MNAYNNNYETNLTEKISEIIEKNRDELVNLVKKTIEEELIIPPAKSNLRLLVEGIVIGLITSEVNSLIVKYAPVVIDTVKSVLLGETEGDLYKVSITDKNSTKERNKIQEKLIHLIEKEEIEFKNESDYKMFTHGINRGLEVIVTEIRIELERH
jgi:hypothetical protein